MKMVSLPGPVAQCNSMFLACNDALGSVTSTPKINHAVTLV